MESKYINISYLNFLMQATASQVRHMSSYTSINKADRRRRVIPNSLSWCSTQRLLPASEAVPSGAKMTSINTLLPRSTKNPVSHRSMGRAYNECASSLVS